MVETKPFKTKLCVLYQRGRCGRQSCTFAHGNSELRRIPGSFANRRDSRGYDLRNKLDRRRSPLHRYSPGRDAKGWHGNQRFRPLQPIKRRKFGRLDSMDGQSDLSESFKVSDSTADQGKDKNLRLSDSANFLDDELKQVQYEVDVLLDDKDRLEIELQERIQEADILTSRIRDLEAQFSREKAKSKRINSKIKKLVRAHVHQNKLEDEFKRSQVQFQKLVEELGLDAAQHASDDNLKINIISDEILDMKSDHMSPAKKQMPQQSSMEGPKLANITKEYKIRSEESSRRNLHVTANGHKESEVGSKRKDDEQLQPTGSKSRGQSVSFKGSTSLDKLKVSESNNVAPPTSMAAHAVDDFVDQIEVDDRSEAAETPAHPTLPSMLNHNYFQREGDDENVDVEGPEEAEEVEIV